MKVLLPISQFRISYEVAAGRPYSRFEALTLKAISQGATSLAALKEIFHVHPRLTIDALVTLTQAGWLAIGTDGKENFVLTAEGEKALSQEGTPESLVVTSQSTRLLLDRLTGGVVGNSEASFLTSKKLGKTRGDWFELPMEVVDNTLDEGQVYPLLPRKEGEWIRWIGPIEMMTKDSTWLPLNVDVAKGLVVGLPEAWTERLKPVVLDECSRKAPTLEAAFVEDRHEFEGDSRSIGDDDDAQPVRKLGQVCWPALVSVEDWLLGAEDHSRHLAHALASARETVFIASAFLAADVVRLVAPTILAAVARGVVVDVLWGYGATREGIEELKRIAYEVKRDRLQGRLQFNAEPSHSHAKLVIVDAEEATIGSFNWMSSPGAGDTLDVSLRIREPEILSAVAHCAASLWSAAKSGSLTSIPDKWRRIASEIEQRSRDTGAEGGKVANATLRLILDRDHLVVLREALTRAQSRLLVVSHQLGDVSLPRMMANDRGPALGDYRVVYDVVHADPEIQARLAQVVSSRGGTLVHRNGTHAKIVGCDQWICVSSYNFLSADPFDSGARSREVGILVDGSDAVESFWARIANLSAGSA